VTQLAPMASRAALLQQRIDAALEAFATDITYAVSIARAAVVITNKRRAYLARRALLEAEAAAHAECAPLSFECHALSPCGTGDCKFARDSLATLVVPAAGTSKRPQAASTGGYDLQPAITALARRIES
jgi:hypothetical protein